MIDCECGGAFFLGLLGVFATIRLGVLTRTGFDICALRLKQ